MQSEHEIPFSENISPKKILGAYVDIIDKETNNNYIVWEIKAVQDLSYMHYLQIITYMCMVEKNKVKNNSQRCYKYRLFNVLDDQILEFSASPNNINNIFTMIVDYKYNIYKIKKKVFLENNKKVYNKYFIHNDIQNIVL